MNNLKGAIWGKDEINCNHYMIEYNKHSERVEFINNPESEVVEKLEMSKDEIKEAKDELIKLSCNPKERELYEKRKESILNKVSALESAEKKVKKKVET